MEIALPSGANYPQHERGDRLMRAERLVLQGSGILGSGEECASISHGLNFSASGIHRAPVEDTCSFVTNLIWKIIEHEFPRIAEHRREFLS